MATTASKTQDLQAGRPSAPSFVDLFAGAGGFTLGFRRAGMTGQAVAFEVDPECADTLRLNFPDLKVVEADVRDADFTSLRADVVVAGPPCQGFSKLNRYREDDPRNLLYEEVLRAAEEIQPSFVVTENVPAFLESRSGRHYVETLEARGMTVRHGVINVADFGVPQRRQRALVIAARRGMGIPWPAPTHATRPGPGRERHRTVADAFAMLPTDPTGENWHRRYADDRAYANRYRTIPEGGGRKDLPPDLVLECWKRTDGFSDVFGRLAWNRPATTVRTEFFRAEKGRFLHPSADRPITPREAARLQSFPDSFMFPEEQTLQAVARQIGNAMPPRAAEAVGSAIMAVGGSHDASCVTRDRYIT